MTTTLKEIRQLVSMVDKLATELGLYEGEEWTTTTPTTGAGTFNERGAIPEHLKDSAYRLPHATLQEGSATYGRAWRLCATGGTHYGTAEYDPFRLGSGYLGNTKSEAYRTLRGLLTGLELARAQKESK
jgi:hypothetical protein